MGMDLDTTNDDWEQLLEFDDSDSILPSNTGRKQQPPSNTPTSEHSAETTGITPTDSAAINPRNSSEQLQAEEKQATEDEDKSSGEGDEEPSHPGTSLCNVRREHEISQHSWDPHEQDFNEESSSFHDKRCDDSGADCSEEEDLICLKQRFRRDRLDVRHNVEENDDQDADQNVILLSGVGRDASKQRFSRVLPDNEHNMEEANDQDGEQDGRLPSSGRRDRRASVGGGYGSSEEARGRANKRTRQDENAGTGSDDQTDVDDLARGGMNCSQGGIPGYGRSLQASSCLSSRERPLVQEAAKNGLGCHILGMEWDCPMEREPSPPVRVLGYKIPGPAGAVQSCLNSTVLRAKGLTHVEKYCGPRRLSHIPISAADTLDFREGPWLAAMEYLNDGDHSSRSTIDKIKATKLHIPQLVAIINTSVRNGLGDLSVTLKDPTGTIGGTIHRKVLTELEDGHLVTPGAVIIIQKVAVFSPTPFKHYLNITIRNVDRIFGKDTIFPRRRGKSINGIPGQEHPFPKPGLNDVLQKQTTAEEGYQSETIAPNFCHSDREGVTDLTHTLHNDERIQADETLGSGTRVRKSVPLEDAIDSRKRANVGNPNHPPSEVFSDDRASQDAKAKAAGWDFSEDVEHLLADEFF